MYIIAGSINELLLQTSGQDGKISWMCIICKKYFLTKGNGARHIETIHCETPSLECEICGKVLKNKNSYQNHMFIIHGCKKRGQSNSSFNFNK